MPRVRRRRSGAPPRAADKRAAAPGSTQPSRATSVPTHGKGRRTWLLAVSILGVAGALAFFLLHATAPRPPIPRVADPGSLAPEIRSLIQDATSELERDPSTGDRWGRLGMACEANGLVAPAVEAYEGATIVQPTEPRWWYRLAMVHSRMGRREAALESLRKAIELSPGYAPAHWRLGLWLLDADDTEGAARGFRTRQRAQPGRSRGRCRPRARLPAAPGGVSRPSTCSSERWRSGQGDRYAMQLLGTAYSRLGRAEDASSALALGVTGEPAWPDPWTDEMTSFRRGFAVRLKDATQHFLDGRTGPAIALLEALHREKPDDTGAAQPPWRGLRRRAAARGGRPRARTGCRPAIPSALVRICRSPRAICNRTISREPTRRSIARSRSTRRSAARMKRKA